MPKSWHSLGRSLWLGCTLFLAGTAAAAAAPDAELAPQPLLLDVTLNGAATGDPHIVLTRGDGRIWLAKQDLAEWRLRLPTCEAVPFDHQTYCRADNLPMRLNLSEAEQTLMIEAGAEMFAPQSHDLGTRTAAEMTPAGTGAFLNYDMVAERSEDGMRLGGAFEAGIFTPHGVGTTSFVAQSGGRRHYTRLETAWTIDRPGRMTTLRFGDSVSRGGPMTYPLRFAGVQYGRNFAVQPGFVTMPLPSVGGSAALPSVVDVYVNNVLQGSERVDPGPFELANLPVDTGGGDVKLVVRDVLGRETVSSHPYYAAIGLLQPGLSDFSYEAGFLRKRFAVRSNQYGLFIASATHRTGMKGGWTLEGHAEATRKRQVASGAINGAFAGFGLVSLSAAASRGPDGTGASIGGAIERRGFGLSLGVRAEYATGRFVPSAAPEAYPTPRLTLQAFADAPTGWGTAGVNIIHRSYRVGESETLASAFTSVQVGNFGSLQLFARRSTVGHSNITFGANFAVAFGGRKSASASYEQRRGGGVASVAFQQDLPAGEGFGYHAAATTGAVESINAGARLQTSWASYGVHVARAGGGSGIRLSAVGALGTVGGQTFASRSLGSSFGTVELPGYADVRVYADNQLVGRTNGKGRVVIPSLRAFESNVIRIDDADLPLDVQLAKAEQEVRPFARSGAVVRFEVKRERGALLRVTLDDGSMLPAGSIAERAGTEDQFTAASGGEIYVPDLSGTASFRVTMTAGRCGFTVTVPDNDDPQPRIDGLICQAEGTYAAR